MNFHSKPNTYVSHVNIKVSNLKRSLTFYKDIIGFDVLEASDNHASLTTNGKTSVLSLVQIDNATPKSSRTTGLYHFAILLPKRSDLADIILHLVKHQIPVSQGDHDVSEALYLNDPDGNGIEIYSDNDPSTWNWNNGEVEMGVKPLKIEEILAEKTGNTWDKLPEDTVMGHIHLHVSDLEAAKKFYTEGLGYDIVCRYGDQALFLSTGRYHHHIAINVWAGVGAPVPSENSVGLNDYSLMFSGASERDAVIEQLKVIGAEVVEDDDTVVTKDPSGNKIILEI